MNEEKKALLDIIQDEKTVYLLDGDEIITFTADKVFYHTQENINLTISIVLEHDEYGGKYDDNYKKILDIENYDKLIKMYNTKKENTGFDIYLHGEVYYKTKVHKVYSIGGAIGNHKIVFCLIDIVRDDFKWAGITEEVIIRNT